MRGHVIGVKGLLRDAPRALYTTALRRAFDRRPILPWIPYDAIAALEELIRPDWRILEFGSGMSTIWLAARCSYVTSIEDDPDWHMKVAGLLRAYDLQSHVALRAQDRSNYVDLTGVPDDYFDMCFIDGIRRADCLKSAVRTVKSGGYVYWDNSDNLDADAREAEQVLEHIIQTRNGRLTYFLGFPPTTLHVTQGVLAHI